MRICICCNQESKNVSIWYLSSESRPRSYTDPYRSRYGCIPIPGDFNAWNFVICPGSAFASEELAFTNRSSTAASTVTIAWPSICCSGVFSMVTCEQACYSFVGCLCPLRQLRWNCTSRFFRLKTRISFGYWMICEFRIVLVLSLWKCWRCLWIVGSGMCNLCWFESN